jgi:stress response protein YsnF
MTELTRTMGVPYSIEKEEQEEESNKISTKDDIENSIPIIEERLEVSKKESIDEAKVIKEPLRETKTVEVQLAHEELIIKKRSVEKTTPTRTTTSSSESEPSPEPTLPSSSTHRQQKSIVQSKTEIKIPLKREEVVVSKKPYVKEEIVIKKKPVTKTKTVTEEVTNEKVTVMNSAGEVLKEEEQKM